MLRILFKERVHITILSLRNVLVLGSYWPLKYVAKVILTENSQSCVFLSALLVIISTSHGLYWNPQKHNMIPPAGP